MADFDGYIKVSTKLNNVELEKGLTQAQKKIRSLSTEFKKTSESIKGQSVAIEKMKSELEGIASGKVVPKEIGELKKKQKEITDEIKKQEEAERKLLNSYNEASGALKPFQEAQAIVENSTVKTKDEVAKMYQSYLKQNDALNEMTINEAFSDEDIARMEASVDSLFDSYKTAKDELTRFNEAQRLLDSSGYESAQDKVTELDGELKKVGETLFDLEENSTEISNRISDIRLDPTASQEYQELNDKIQMSESALEETRKKANKLASAFNMAQAKERLDKVNGSLRKIGGSIVGVIGSMRIFKKEGKTGTTALSNGFERLFKRITRLVAAAFVFNVIRKGLSQLSEYIGTILKQNQHFVSSLAQIKGNLLTAFQPIYEAILPILNQLMSALAKATAYVAAFINIMFGKSLKQSQAAAKAMYKQAQATKKAGEAAKKANKDMKNLSASLDELTIAQEDNVKADDSTTIVPEFKIDPSEIDMTALESVWDKIRQVASSIWDVFAQSWSEKGEKVMNSFKYALGSILELIKTIGKTFLEVWTGGKGLELLNAFWNLLSTILGIIGDIASAFTEAWKTDGTGKALVESLFNMLTAILELLNAIGESFRNAWNDGVGVSIATNILQIFTNINDIITSLAENLRVAWEANGNGERIWGSILGIVNKVLGSLNKMTKATAKWAENLNFEPVVGGFASLLEAIEGLAGVLMDDLAWAWENVVLPFGKWLVELVVPAALNILANAFDVIKEVLVTLQPLGIWLWENFLQPLASWTGDAIVSILNSIADALGGISDWISNNQTVVENMAIAIGLFFAAWKVTELLAFMQTAGGVTGALKLLKTSIMECIVAKAADRLATIASTAILAKDFIVSVAKGTTELIKQAAQWVINTGLKIADTAAQVAMTAATVAWNVACTVASAVTTAFGAAVAFLTSPIGLVVLAIGALIAIVVLLVKNWDKVKETAVNVWNGIVDTFKGLADWFNEKVVTPISNFFGGLWDGIRAGAGALYDFIKDKAVKPIVNTLYTMYKGAVTIIEGVINGFVGIINGFLSGINTAIEIINKIPKVNIPELKTLSKVSLERIPMPGLATGAVLPPNKPFMAMVGDQRHGTNIEAPMDTIKQGVREVLAEMGSGGNEETNRLLRELIAVVHDKDTNAYLYGQKITNDVEKRQRRRGIQITGGEFQNAY